MGFNSDMGAPQSWEIEEPEYYVPKAKPLPRYPTEEAAREALRLLSATGHRQGAATSTEDEAVRSAVAKAEPPNLIRGWGIRLETSWIYLKDGEIESRPR